jgi:PEP-CTERM motif
MKRLATALAVGGLLLGSGSVAFAVPIGTISGCADCDGLVFSLSVDPDASDLNGDGTTDDLLYTLTLDSTGYTGLDTDYISWVSPNLAHHDGAAQGVVTAPGTWVFHDGGANNNSGCNDALAAGKVCSQDATQLALLDGTMLYSWQFFIDIDESNNDPIALHLQAAWFSDGEKVGAISENFVAPGGSGPGVGRSTPGGEIPEPTSLLLMGSGLAAAAMRLRRKQN